MTMGARLAAWMVLWGWGWTAVVAATDCCPRCPQQDFLFMPKGSPPAAVVDVVDFREADLDTRLAAITLQGQINSGPESSVCLLLYGGDNTSTAFWLPWFRERGYIRQTAELTPDAYFEKYADAYDRVFVYDPALAASINVATMLASLERGIVVAPDDAQRFAAGKAVENLGGRWRTNLEAYEWAFETLWPRMNHRVVGWQHPTFTKHHLRDYFIRHRVFHFWVTGPEAANRDPAADHEAETAFAEKVWAASPPNIPLVGWPGTDHTDEGLTEYGGVGLAGRYGKITVCSNWGVNLSLISGITVDVPAMVARYRQRLTTACPPLQDDKVYVCYAIQESGDAPIYWQAVQEKVWRSGRGRIPIGWSLGVPVFELCPAILEWFYDHATPQDHFYLCISGLGYCHPYRQLYDRTADPEAAWREHMGIVEHYLEVTGIKAMGLYTDAWVPFDRSKTDATTMRFVDGLPSLEMLIMGMGRDEDILEQGHNYLLGDRGVLVSHVVTRWDSANIGRSAANNTWLVNEIKAHTPPARPGFIVVHPISWSYYPADLADVQEQLGDDYVAVSPAHFYRLYMQRTGR